MIDSIWMCSQQIEMFSILLIGYSWEEEGISYCLLSFFCLEKVDRLQSSVCGLSFSVFLGSGLASAVSCVQHYMTFHLEVCVNSRDTAEYSWRRDEWSFRRYTKTRTHFDSGMDDIFLILTLCLKGSDNKLWTNICMSNHYALVSLNPLCQCLVWAMNFRLCKLENGRVGRYAFRILRRACYFSTDQWRTEVLCMNVNGNTLHVIH